MVNVAVDNERIHLNLTRNQSTTVPPGQTWKVRATGVGIGAALTINNGNSFVINRSGEFSSPMYLHGGDTIKAYDAGNNNAVIINGIRIK